jgi:hypothetical protein
MPRSHTTARSLLLLASLGGALPLLPLTIAVAAEKDPSAALTKQTAPTVRIPPRDLMVLQSPSPTILTLAPVSPTNIRIEWSAVPGAVRYVISRSGAADIPIEANAGYQQGNKFVYVDVGRRPATLHTYSVAAHFAAPTLPGRSAAVQVLTPVALAPPSFKAFIAGSNAISLSWGSRSEAAAYRLVRNGGNLPPAVITPQGLGYVDQNLPAGDYSYALYSIVRLANGEELSGEMTAPITLKLRPFNMVAIGDSVMWGQGLLPANKFAVKVRDWIASQIGEPVDLRMRAHSGAITYPTPGEPVYENRAYDGEVPADWPTISHQIALASSPSIAGQPPADQVDLVLIDGCANNVGILTVLNPFPVPGLDDESLRNDTRAYCGAGMTNLLRETVRRFPNADIIVTGYFPYVSRESELAAMLPIFVLVGGAVPPDPLSGGLDLTMSYRNKIATRSDIFYQESNSGLQAAVDTINREEFPGRTRFDQIRYARLNAGPKNAYAAPSTWQFLIPAPPFAQDEVYEARRAQCYKVMNEARGNPDLMPGANLLCIQASMGHPNVAGAQAYTDAIRAVAAPLVTTWRTAHLSSMTARDDSFVVRVQSGSTDASGGTLVITATDAISGAPLQGTVQFNGVAAGVLGAPVRYAYQQSNPAEIAASVTVPGRQPRSFAIPPRTISVAVNLTNGGNPRTALVTATDTATGQLLGGTVTIRSATGSAVSGSTGQPLTYPSCGPDMPIYRVSSRPVEPLPCFGAVRVPFYPEVAYQDVPNPTATIRLLAPTQP